MKFLKQGVCLALVGAGLAAAPLSLAAAAAPTGATAARAAKASPDLVAQIRDGARAWRPRRRSPRTGASGMVRAGANGDLLPSVAGDGKAAAAAKSDSFLAKYGGAFGAASGQLARKKTESDRPRRLDVDVHPDLQGPQRVRRADHGPRRQRRRPDLGVRLRRT